MAAPVANTSSGRDLPSLSNEEQAPYLGPWNGSTTYTVNESESASDSEYDNIAGDQDNPTAFVSPVSSRHRISLIPPSPQLDAASEDTFWLGHDTRRSHRRTMRLPFDLSTDWYLGGGGNVFWGFHRQRRRHAIPGTYGTLDQSTPQAHLRHGDSSSRALGPVGFRTQSTFRTMENPDPLLQQPASPAPNTRPMLEHAFRPTTQVIDELLSSSPRRLCVLIWIPVLLVLLWCGMPFPLDDGDPRSSNATFWFFLLWYYGCYVSVALIFVTQLFTLYRLNWWPASIGARMSYTFFWVLSLWIGYIIHKLEPTNSRDKTSHPTNKAHQHEPEWQLKTEWVLLTFATMSMPAFVCLIGLRRSGRQRYRLSVTDVQKPFASTEAAWRIPSSYRRFLWFMASLGLSLFTLLAGQSYAIVYMNTLPHTGTDGTLYVAFWMLTVHVLSAIVQWIMSEKVRSRALLFAFKYYYFMVYFIFYRNLFARLRSFDQFALIQLLSSTWVCLWYPFCMSQTWLWILNRFSSRPISHGMHVEKISLYFYLRTIAQHTTMLAFLGWLSLLHFGINQPLYPFFAFDDNDPYNYRLTMLGSLAIWASEMISNLFTALLCRAFYGVHAAHLGLAEMCLYPELVPTLVWTSLHVLMNMLFFLIVRVFIYNMLRSKHGRSHIHPRNLTSSLLSQSMSQLLPWAYDPLRCSRAIYTY